MPGQAKILTLTDMAQLYAGGNGHGKRIHRKGHGNGDNIQQRQYPILISDLRKESGAARSDF